MMDRCCVDAPFACTRSRWIMLMQPSAPGSTTIQAMLEARSNTMAAGILTASARGSVLPGKRRVGSTYCAKSYARKRSHPPLNEICQDCRAQRCICQLASRSSRNRSAELPSVAMSRSCGHANRMSNCNEAPTLSKNAGYRSGLVAWSASNVAESTLSRRWRIESPLMAQVSAQWHASGKRRGFDAISN